MFGSLFYREHACQKLRTIGPTPRFVEVIHKMLLRHGVDPPFAVLTNSKTGTNPTTHLTLKLTLTLTLTRRQCDARLQ